MFNSYNFLLIAFFSSGAYTISFFLAKYGRIKLLAHRRFWNFALLVFFVVSGFLGMALAFLIDYKLSFGWYRELLWFHVEAGIAMAVISIFHILWHWPYWRLRRTSK